MARKLDTKVLVVDLESTAWEPESSKPENEISEIIEIGLSVVNIQSLTIEKTTSILVKPQRSKVSDFCTSLTTLTQEQVDQGILLKYAIEVLKFDYKSKNRTWISWGDYDRKMFEKNCKDYNLEYPFGPRHLNFKNNFSLLHGLNKELGLDEAVKFLNLEFDGTHHRGDSDSKNIAKIFIETLKKFRTT